MFGVAIPYLKHFQNTVFGTVRLEWDCFGVQIIIFQILSGTALRAMTGPQWESAFILFVIFQ
jgi:hypothetical protein